MRLDKFLAEHGLGTRSEIKDLLAKGLVTVNNQIIKSAKYQLKDTELMAVSYNGELLSKYQHHVFILHKPQGVLSATTDDSCPCAIDYLPVNLQTRSYNCIGRLDKYSEGLLLLTNDGELLHRLTQPKWQVNKQYYVEFNPALADGEGEIIAKQFKTGLALDDFVCQPALFEMLSASSAKVTVSEGKFHQVRRMLDHFKHEVTTLVRIQEGPISLENLPAGTLRELTDEEYKSLYAEVNLTRE